MDNDENEKVLVKEYVERYKKLLYWPMKVIGFARFDLKNNKFIELTLSTLVYRSILLIIVDLCVAYLLYTSIISKNYLKIPDGLCIIHFGLFANMLLINLTFVNRQSGLLLIGQSFKIDLHLGIKQTNFMRDVEVKTFICLSLLIAFTNLSGSIFMYTVYDNVSMSIHIIGSLYFFWLFFSYNDYCFCLVYASFIALRVRYLNVALANFGGVNVKYLSNRSLLNIFSWKKQYDGWVAFQRSSLYDFRTAFEMVFDMLRLMEKIYQFPLGLGFWTLIVGTFVTSQTFIERIKNPNALEQERTCIILGWCLLTWSFFILISLFMDLFQQQIEQTRLICACIQLKPNKPAEMYKLTKTLLRLLERHESRLSIYNLFFFDTGFMLRMAAATLVYMTVQLQLAFPKLPTNTKSNVTISD